MFRRICVAVLLFTALPDVGYAGYLTDNPDEVFESVYARLGPLPVAAARDPSVWLKLEELKREPCDQKSIDELSQWLDKLGYRRQAADGLYNFVKACGAPLTALNKAVGIYMKLTDYPKAVEAADEYVRRAPSDQNARYLRGMALDGAGDYRRALTDYSDTIELYSGDKKTISSNVFLRMANAYAALKQFCEATAPINRWVALDPAARDTSKTQKIITDYERQGNCVSSSELRKESFPLQKQRGVVIAKAEINGVRGLFVLDTGASYVSVKSAFASKAKIADAGSSEITLSTPNGQIKARLSRADKVALGKLEATNVPIAVQKDDDKSFGPGIDGLLGMSFLSRFEVQMARGSMEIRTRQSRK
ncbi:TIGR02281 family clan AA aspartic protease [Bradyrhizobium diazoefficiens]|nr:TIGR02281 family clan AA aspartic protease [Bradyrhizobium diazoefficiens]